MKTASAMKEAIKRWGDKAAIEDKLEPRFCKSGAKISERFVVGRVMMGMFFEVKGDGETWEAAFAKADDAERRDRERYATIRKQNAGGERIGGREKNHE